MASDSSFAGAGTQLAFDLDSQAGVMHLLSSVRASEIPSHQKNELRDLIFLYTNGGHDQSVRITLEQKVSQYGVQPIAQTAPKSSQAEQPNYEFGTSRPAPTFQPPQTTPAGTTGESGSESGAPQSQETAPEASAPQAQQPQPTKQVQPEPPQQPQPPAQPTPAAQEPTPSSQPTEPANAPSAGLSEPQAAAPQQPVQPVAPGAQQAPAQSAEPTLSPNQSQALTRIREIKAFVNEKVGNPVNLVDIDNAVGREYMSALLEAMKKVNGGAAPDTAMSKLEEAFAKVQKAIAEHDEAPAEAKETSQPTPQPKQPEPSAPTQPAEPVQPEPSQQPQPTKTEQPKAESAKFNPINQPASPDVKSQPETQPTPTPQTDTPEPAPQPARPEQTQPRPETVAQPQAARAEEKPNPGHAMSSSAFSVQSEATAQPPKPAESTPEAEPAKSEPPRPEEPKPETRKFNPVSQAPEAETKAEPEPKESARPQVAPTPPPAPPPSPQDIAPSPSAAANEQQPQVSKVGQTASNWGPASDTIEEDKQKEAAQAVDLTQNKKMAEAKKQEEAEATAADDPLYTKEVDQGLDQLLSEWSLFKKSGLFGTGPKGREHPLFKKIAGLQIPLLLAGRFEGATQEIKQSITDYMNGWRYEQGIIYKQGETFEHYLRRVIRHILDLQNKK